MTVDVKFGDEIDKKKIGMKLTVGVKFGDEVDSKKSLRNKLVLLPNQIL